MNHPDTTLIARVLRREPAACRTIVDRLTPVVQRQVNAALLRRRFGTREDVRDLTQEVFRILLEDDAAALRRWAPDKGASLEGWVGLIAERKVGSILASGRKSGHAEDATEDAKLEALATTSPSPEHQTTSREELRQVLDALKSSLSDQGFELFVLLFVEQRDVEWVMAHRSLSRDAVYAWRSRLSKRAREISRKMQSDPRTTPGRMEHGGSP